MLTSTMLVILMVIPGLALFYGGLVRTKNMLSVLCQVFVIFSLITLLWAVYGYSLTFAGEGNFFGGFSKIFLKGIAPDTLAGALPTIPEYVFVAFQSTFAAITVALIVGAFAERIKFSAVILFSVLWFTFSYIPMAHMVWGGGLLGKDGALDFAAAPWCTSTPVSPVWWLLHAGQAHRLRPRGTASAQPDADHGRCLAAVGGLVRLQRRLGRRCQRHCRPGLHQHHRRHGRRHHLVAGCRSPAQGQGLDCWAPPRAPWAAWWSSPRRPASWAPWVPSSWA